MKWETRRQQFEGRCKMMGYYRLCLRCCAVPHCDVPSYDVLYCCILLRFDALCS